VAQFLSTVRLDSSDEAVFERAAGPGEWAVPGSFAFWDLPDEALREGKTAQAFRQGFLGLSSFGHSTLVCVSEIDAAQLESLAGDLARHFVERYGAPDLEAALPVAREEIGLAADLCEHEVGTLLAVEREVVDGEIKERFKVVRDRRRGVDHATVKLWEIVPDEGRDER
jgi:hypothetical protein